MTSCHFCDSGSNQEAELFPGRLLNDVYHINLIDIALRLHRIAGMSATAANTALNKAVKPSQSPSPCPNSALNQRAQEWWTCSSTKPKTKRSIAQGSIQIPTNWPDDVVFLTQNLVAPSIPQHIARDYVLQPSDFANPHEEEEEEEEESDVPSNLPRATHRDGRADTLYATSIQEQVPLIILPLDEKSPWCPESFHSTSRNLTRHPSAGSFGLFAAEDIPYNTFIRPYLGVLHRKADADFHSTYDLSLCHDPRLAESSSGPEAVADRLQAVSLDETQEEQDPTALYLDSRYWGNESRFVNDYRGIAERPNVEFRSFIQHDPASSDEPSDESARFQMGLFSIRPIRKGQELVINYGKSYWIHHDQLEELQKVKARSSSAKLGQQNPTPPLSAIKLDPIQAMLQRSQMRVSRTALNPQRPPQRPPPRTS